MLRALLLLLAVLPAGPASAGPAPASPFLKRALGAFGPHPATARALSQDTPPSLEDLLERARAEGAGLRAEYALELPALLDRLAGGLADDREREIEVPLERLGEMGGTGGELLAEALRTPPQAERPAAARAEAALHALLFLRPAAAGPALQHEANTATGDSRRRMLRALTACTPPAEAAEFLKLYYDEHPATLARSAVLSAVPYVDHPTSVVVLDTALGSDQARLRRDAVRAASEARLAPFLPSARAALADPALGKELLEPLVDYLLGLELEDPLEDFRAIARHLTGSGAVSSDVAVRVLDACHGLELEHKRMEPLLGSVLGRGGELAQAGQILLARGGSREALKKLEKKADEAIEKAREGTAAPVLDRAELYLRLGEYGKSVSDYRRALKLSEGSSIFAQNTARLGLARAFAADGKFSRAQGELEDARVSPRKLVELAEEPYFREMAAHSRYGDLFREARRIEGQ